MPYVDQEVRKVYDPLIEALQEEILAEGDTPGDLNYVISRIVGRVWKNTPRYKTICIVIGTLVCVAFEFYRRVAGGYEDKAIKKNGDIPEYDNCNREGCGGPADCPCEDPRLDEYFDVDGNDTRGGS
jgi:hypothetical protein